MVKLAPTGIAAQNIGGSTIHNLFKFSTEILVPERVHTIDQRMHDVLNAMDILLIDEISMVRSDVFQAMDFILRKVTDIDMPFGGKQIIVVGDFCQLPPIITDISIQKYFDQAFGGAFAFETSSWQEAEFKTIKLDTIHRQNDLEFTKLLNNVRKGISTYWAESLYKEKYPHMDLFSIFDRLNEICCRPMEPDAIALCCTRVDAERINMAALELLKDKGICSYAIINGDFPRDSYPTDYNLNIRTGMRVMLLRNEQDASDNFEYVNGDVGVVLSYCNASGNPKVRVQLQDDRIVNVGIKLWEHFEYDTVIDECGTRQIEQHKTGSFLQLPLAPAYAVTIHKSQGKTLDKIHLVLNRGCFASGQLYTGLSRVRKMDQITIDRPVFEGDVIIKPEVLDFYGYSKPWE